MNDVLMLGLDGATFSLLKPLMAEGIMPFLKKLVGEGVHGDLMSTANPLTPPAWISTVTGRSPEAHGIFDFLRPVPGATNVLFRPYDFRDIRCETIWSMVTRANKRVTSLNFYGMAPPSPVNGYLISGFTTWKHLRSATYPPSLFETMKTLPNFDYKKLGMDIREEKRALWGLQEGKHKDWIKMHLDRDRAWTDLLCHVMETDPTDLTAMVFDGPDKLQHLFWRYLDPQLVEKDFNAWDALIRELCLDYYQLLDSSIERIVNLAGPDTNVILTSDHGFGATTEVVYINEWLSRNQYLKWSEKAEVDAVGRIASDYVKDNRMMFDWDETIAYCMTASSNGIYLKKDRGDGKGVSDRDYVEICRRLQQQLLDYRDPEDNGLVFVNVYLNERKLAGKPGVENCPDLTVNIRDGGFVSVLKSPKVVVQRSKPEGTHRPNGIFIARGPDIESGEQINPLSILDVAPLILYLLGLPVPEDLEGRVPTEVIKADKLMTHPVRVKGRTISPDANDEDLGDGESEKREMEASEEQKEALLAQLKLLGYLE